MKSFISHEDLMMSSSGKMPPVELRDLNYLLRRILFIRGEKSNSGVRINISLVLVGSTWRCFRLRPRPVR